MKRKAIIVLILLALTIVVAENTIKLYKNVYPNRDTEIPIPSDIIYKCTQVNDSTVIVIRHGGFTTKELSNFKKL